MKKLLRVLLTFAFLLIFSTARAQETWLPEFDPNVHVYVAPGMNKSPNFTEDFSSQLMAKAVANNLNVYIIYTQQGDELADEDLNRWAKNLLCNRLWESWRGTPGFADKESRILVLLRVDSRQSDFGAIAARAGHILQTYGLDESSLASASGPLLLPSRQYMQVDQQQAFLAILDSINEHIAHSFRGRFGVEVLDFVLGVLVLVVVLFVIRGVRRSRVSAVSGGSDWFDDLDSDD